MNPKTHPIRMTATDVRRSIQRLEGFEQMFPSDMNVVNGSIAILLNMFKEIHRVIPAEFKDA